MRDDDYLERWEARIKDKKARFGIELPIVDYEDPKLAWKVADEDALAHYLVDFFKAELSPFEIIIEAAAPPIFTVLYAGKTHPPGRRFIEYRVEVEVIDLRTIRPMDVDAIKTSVEKTNRAVVLEEGWEICGIGSQVVDYVQRECFDVLDAPVVRVHQADVPMPYAKNLERAAKPDVGKAIAAVRKVMYLD